MENAKVRFVDKVSKEFKSMWREYEDDVIYQAFEMTQDYGVVVDFIANANGIASITIEHFRGFTKIYFTPCFNHLWHEKSDWKDCKRVIRRYFEKED